MGKFHSVADSGFLCLNPCFTNIAYSVDTRELCIDIPPGEVYTRDNVSVTIDGVLFIKFFDPEKAV